jgi:transcriptional regulator with PAS, ATPase and Fis domain
LQPVCRASTEASRTLLNIRREVHVPHDDRADLFRTLTICLQVLAAPLPQGETHSRRTAGTASTGAPMRQVLALAQRVAPLDSTVLITGESGVGKERLARWLHGWSRRSRGPFIAVNCGALAETLIESELFGHARGAFTGAEHDRPGLFEAANHGTLLLDEVGELSPQTQVRLLRVLQEREVLRVGERKPRPVDVRLIAATNRRLAEEIKEGRFRRDLYYRLDVIHLHVPPLRQRLDEVLDLARHLLVEITTRLGRPMAGYTPAAIDRLLEYPWPGNIRELQHAIEHACAVSAGSIIDIEDLPEAIRGYGGAATVGAQHALIVHECAYIRAVLERLGGSRQRAADELGISLSTLKRRLKRGSSTP